MEELFQQPNLQKILQGFRKYDWLRITQLLLDYAITSINIKYNTKDLSVEELAAIVDKKKEEYNKKFVKNIKAEKVNMEKFKNIVKEESIDFMNDNNTSDDFGSLEKLKIMDDKKKPTIKASNKLIDTNYNNSNNNRFDNNAFGNDFNNLLTLRGNPESQVNIKNVFNAMSNNVSKKQSDYKLDNSKFNNVISNNHYNNVIKANHIPFKNQVNNQGHTPNLTIKENNNIAEFPSSTTSRVKNNEYQNYINDINEGEYDNNDLNYMDNSFRNPNNRKKSMEKILSNRNRSNSKNKKYSNNNLKIKITNSSAKDNETNSNKSKRKKKNSKNRYNTESRSKSNSQSKSKKEKNKNKFSDNFKYGNKIDDISTSQILEKLRQDPPKVVKVNKKSANYNTLTTNNSVYNNNTYATFHSLRNNIDKSNNKFNEYVNSLCDATKEKGNVKTKVYYNRFNNTHFTNDSFDNRINFQNKNNVQDKKNTITITNPDYNKVQYYVEDNSIIDNNHNDVLDEDDDKLSDYESCTANNAGTSNTNRPYVKKNTGKLVSYNYNNTNNDDVNSKTVRNNISILNSNVDAENSGLLSDFNHNNDINTISEINSSTNRQFNNQVKVKPLNLNNIDNRNYTYQTSSPSFSKSKRKLMNSNINIINHTPKTVPFNKLEYSTIPRNAKVADSSDYNLTNMNEMNNLITESDVNILTNAFENNTYGNSNFAMMGNNYNLVSESLLSSYAPGDNTICKLFIPLFFLLYYFNYDN